MVLEIVLTTQLVCLAEAVFSESRGEDYAGQLYVAGVVKNRVGDSRWPNTYCDVVAQKGQFTYKRAGLAEKIKSENISWERALQVAQSVVNSDFEFDNVLYFHANSIKPEWDFDKIELVKTIGRHVFYADKNSTIE